MGIPVLILGESGSGKSRSLKNFSSEELLVFVREEDHTLESQTKTWKAGEF